MAALTTFSYTADGVREQIRRGGAKVEVKCSREVIVRRPNGFAFTTKGDEREGRVGMMGTR